MTTTPMTIDYKNVYDWLIDCTQEDALAYESQGLYQILECNFDEDWHEDPEAEEKIMFWANRAHRIFSEKWLTHAEDLIVNAVTSLYDVHYQHQGECEIVPHPHNRFALLVTHPEDAEPYRLTDDELEEAIMETGENQPANVYSLYGLLQEELTDEDELKQFEADQAVMDRLSSW
jgi:hypothetical protein